jgi:hypothetical protein
VRTTDLIWLGLGNSYRRSWDRIRNAYTCCPGCRVQAMNRTRRFSMTSGSSNSRATAIEKHDPHQIVIFQLDHDQGVALEDLDWKGTLRHRML